jgi:hypothetical protein
MQQRDQPRATLVDEAEFLADPGADVARRARKRGVHPGPQGLGLLGVHQARTATRVERSQAFEPAPLEQRVPAADRVVVEQKPLRHFLAALAVVQTHERVGASRHAADRRAVARQRDQGHSIFRAEKAATNHTASRIPKAARCKRFLTDSHRVGVYVSSRSRIIRSPPSSREPSGRGRRFLS